MIQLIHFVLQKLRIKLIICIMIKKQRIKAKNKGKRKLNNINNSNINYFVKDFVNDINDSFIK